MNTAPTQLAARETFLADVVTRAVEDPTLGTWAEVLHYERWPESAPHGGADALVVLEVDGEEIDVTPPILSRVFRRFATDYRIKGLELGTRNRVLDARTANDASQLRPEDASLILQVLIFGDVPA